MRSRCCARSSCRIASCCCARATRGSIRRRRTISKSGFRRRRRIAKSARARCAPIFKHVARTFVSGATQNLVPNSSTRSTARGSPSGAPCWRFSRISRNRTARCASRTRSFRTRALTASQPARSSPADPETLARAARLLREGGVVAFPTETVYGLGADAANAAAVRRVFAVKGRPLGHPVIVHLADRSQIDEWARAVPPAARVLAERFWPGPLTLVLPRSARASDLVTGGQATVALRVPSDPVAREILQRAGIGIIAPSANRFGTVSATRAEHVVADFGDAVDLIVDGGPAAAVLRPGGVSREQIEDVLGAPVRVGGGEIRVPGSLPSHYAPRAQVEVFDELAPAEERTRSLRANGVRVELLAPGGGAEAYARQLYERLREADRRGAQTIVVVAPAEGGLGTAIRDRLRRAAGPRM